MSVTHVVQLVVEPASIADWLAGLVPPPEGRGRCLAVGAAGARPSRRALQRQFWKREDTDITPVTLDVTDDRRAIILARFNPSNIRILSIISIVVTHYSTALHISIIKFFRQLQKVVRQIL